MSKRDMITGDTMEDPAYYYLHENGDLIYKNPKAYSTEDFEESPFVKIYWIIDLENRLDAYHMLISASICGAKQDRIDDLKKKWGITDKDTQVYCDYVNIVYKETENGWIVYGGGLTKGEIKIYGRGNNLFSAVVDFYRNSIELQSE